MKNGKKTSTGSPESGAGSASTPTPALGTLLIQLYDDFAEYRVVSAFVWHAFAALMTEPEWITEETASRARICATELQDAARKLGADIKVVSARYLFEQQKPKSSD